jgi:toxin YoeB
MEIVFSPLANKQWKEHLKSGNKNVFKKIIQLLEAIQLTPFEGLGKPEPLKHNLRGMWSRRINYEDRLVYSIDGSVLIIHALKGHYL